MSSTKPRKNSPQKWILSSTRNSQFRGSNPQFFTSTNPQKTVSFKNSTKNTLKNITKTEEYAYNDTLPTLPPQKVVIGTNAFTKTKTMAFLKYRQQLEEEFLKEEKKKRENKQQAKFLISLKVSESEKANFTKKTTIAKSRFFDEFKEQMTFDDIEFERRIEYDEKVYEENMKERKNLIESLHGFDENPQLVSSLANYKYEYYKKKGFKTSSFNLATEKDEFSLEEFSVWRQLNQKGQAEKFRRNLVVSTRDRMNNEVDNYERYQKKLTERLERLKHSESPTFSPTAMGESTKRKLRKKLTKQATNKNFMFWLDLNKPQRLLLKMKNFLAKLVKLNIPLHEAVENNIFSKRPFQRPNSIEFINAVKEGSLKKAIEILQNDRFLVFEYDQTNENALHWAAKRGYEQLVKFLLENNSDPNSRDIVDRNPLYYAVREKHCGIVKILLAAGSLPWSTRNSDFNKLESTPEIKKILKRAKIAHMAVAIAPKDKKDKIWKEESKLFLINKL